MTDLLAQEVRSMPPTKPTDLMTEQLDRARAYLVALHVSAIICRANFDWLYLNSAVAVPFLDTDVIFGALPKYTASEALKEQLHPSTSDLQPFDLAIQTGPHMVRQHLTALQEFCLPMGTLAEVMNTRRYLRKRMSKKARKIVGSFTRDAPKSAFSKTIRTIGGKSASDVLREDLLSFSADLEDISLLQSLLDRSESAEALMGRELAPEAETAYNEMLELLSRVRPNRSVQNRCDAINAGCVVQVFNYSVLKDRAPKMPVLISNTQSILKHKEILDSKLRPRRAGGSRPEVVANKLSLLVFQMILSYVGGRRYRLMADYAGQIAIDSQEFADACAQVLARPDDQPSQEILAHTARKFKNSWGDRLLPATERARFDRATWVNCLLSEDLAANLDSNDSGRVEAAACELREHLRRHENEDENLWAVLLEYARQEREDERGRLIGRTRVQLTRVLCDGKPLARVNCGIPLTDSDVSECLGEHKFRIVVHRELALSGAVMALDTWREVAREDRQWLRLVWRHSQDLEVMWNTGTRVLTYFCSEQPHLLERVEYRIFSAERTRSGTISAAVGTSPSARPYRRSPDAAFFDLSCGAFTFFADADLLEDCEMQAGLVFPGDSWSRGRMRELAKLVAETNDHVLDRYDVELVLASCIAQVAVIMTS